MTSVAPMAEESVDNLPATWQLMPLRKLLLALETGSRPKGGAIGVTDGVPSLSAEHMTRSGTFDFETMRYVPREFYESMTRGHIERNDILIVKDGATTGKTAFVDDDFPFDEAVVNEHVFLCRPNPNVVCPRYLFYWLWGSAGHAAIRSGFQGAAIGGINQSFAEAVTVPIPPLPEQQRIADILKDKLIHVERAFQSSKGQWSSAKRLPYAELRRFFESDAAQEWPTRPLADVSDFLPAKSIATAGDANVTAITTACLSETFFDDAGLKPSRMYSHDVEECLVQAGEILLARSNTPDLVGRVSIFPGARSDVVATDLTIRLRAKSNTDCEFLARYLSYLFVTGYWKERSGGASGSMKKITRSQLSQEHVPSPPLPEQHRVAAMLNERIRAADRVVQLADEQLDAITQLPTALLREAFSGRL